MCSREWTADVSLDFGRGDEGPQREDDDSLRLDRWSRPEGMEHVETKRIRCVGSDRDLDKLFQAELGRPPSPVDMAAVDKTTLDRYLKILSKSGNPYVYLDVQLSLIHI